MLLHQTNIGLYKTQSKTLAKMKKTNWKYHKGISGQIKRSSVNTMRGMLHFFFFLKNFFSEERFDFTKIQGHYK